MIRLFVETFFELYVSSLLNIVAVEWKTSNALTRASYGVSLGFFVLCNLIVLLLACVYCRNFDKIGLNSNYGALL